MIDTARLRALLAAARKDGRTWTAREVPSPVADMLTAAVNALPALLDELEALRADLDAERLQPLLDYEKQAEAWQTRALRAEAERDGLKEDVEAWRNATHSPTPADLSASVAQHAIDYAGLQSAWRTATGCDTPAEARQRIAVLIADGVQRARASIVDAAELSRLRELEAAKLEVDDADEDAAEHPMGDPECGRAWRRCMAARKRLDAAIAACRAAKEGT